MKKILLSIITAVCCLTASAVGTQPSTVDVVKFYADGVSTSNYPLMWAVTLDYCPGHDLQHTSAKNATCTEKGNKEYWYCAKCETYFADAECSTVMNDWEIPALGHSTTHNAKKEATCTEDGNIEHWHCNRCDMNYNDEVCTNMITGSVVIPMTGHSNEERHGRIEATCLTDGNIKYWYCPDCDTYYTDEACTVSTTEIIINALGHDFTYTPYKTSTCTSEGEVEHWHCNRCNMDFNVDDQMASEDHAISGSLTIPCKESDAILVSMDEGKTYDDCHTFTPPTEEEETATIATVTFDEETVFFKVAGGEETPYSLNAERPLVTVFAHTFKLKANQDPDHPEDYYSTFFTSEGAYKLPTTKVSAKAYTGTVDGENLNMTDAGSIIPQNEAVILKATGSSIVLLPSARQLEASSENDLEGTDKEMQLGSNQYALSLGQNGVGFYLWDGKEIGANKAYLTLSEEADAKSFTFIFDDDPINAIQELTPAISESEEATYNLNGMRVGKDYKGIVIKNGKKVLMK